MIWLLLSLLVGVPVWLVALAAGMIWYRNLRLRRRPGNIPCRLRAGHRWVSGNGLWVHDVFSFRPSAAIWAERMDWVRQASLRPPLPEEARGIRRLSDPIVAILLLDDGTELTVATESNLQARLTGPLPPSAAAG